MISIFSYSSPFPSLVIKLGVLEFQDVFPCYTAWVGVIFSSFSKSFDVKKGYYGQLFTFAKCSDIVVGCSYSRLFADPPFSAIFGGGSPWDIEEERTLFPIKFAFLV